MSLEAEFKQVFAARLTEVARRDCERKAFCGLMFTVPLTRIDGDDLHTLEVSALIRCDRPCPYKDQTEILRNLFREAGQQALESLGVDTEILPFEAPPPADS